MDTLSAFLVYGLAILILIYGFGYSQGGPEKGKRLVEQSLDHFGKFILLIVKTFFEGLAIIATSLAKLCGSKSKKKP